MNRTEVKMDDLPELPFEKVLSYLNLEDRLKLGAVSRGCRQKIANSRVKTLCYSDRPSGFILEKSRWVSGAFAKNFISSTRFESFFNAYGRSIFANLKHLRLCDLNLDLENRTAFTRTLKSFGQLEQLDIIRAKCSRKRTFTLNLPMLTGIHLENLSGIQKLTLNAPRLRKVKHVAFDWAAERSSALLDIVHGESVESLCVWDLTRITQKAVKNLKNLKYMHVGYLSRIDSTFLSSLEQLKELHLLSRGSIKLLFQQKQQYGRVDLKIYLDGYLLSGPDDPTIPFNWDFLLPEDFRRLTESPSRLADVIQLHDRIYYYDDKNYFPKSKINFLSRFADLKSINAQHPIRDIENFLNLLKNCDIVELQFWGPQPQELFERLPEHCAVQRLEISVADPDLRHLLRLKHLIHLDIYRSFDVETIRKVFEELPFVSLFKFLYLNKVASIESAHPEQFTASVEKGRNVHGEKTVSNLNAAFLFIQEFVEAPLD